MTIDSLKTRSVCVAEPVVDPGFCSSGWHRERRVSQAMELCNYSALLAQRGEHTAALAFLEQVLIEYPDIAANISGLQFSRAVCLRALHRFEEAQTAIRAELTLNPQYPSGHKLLADIGRERRIQNSVCDVPVSPPPANARIPCELCGIEPVYFERQFDKDWYVCPKCNLLRCDVSQNQTEYLDKGSPAGSKSPTYSAIHRREEFFCRLFVENLQLKGILLYGIGWSPVYKNLREAGYKVVGCDLWQPLIDQRNREFGQGSFYHRDELPDIRYDLISAFEVFEHFLRPVQEISLLADLLNDHGVIVGCTDFWHGGSLQDHPNPDKSYWRHKSHVTAWTWKSMNAVAKHLGLKTYYFKTDKCNFAAKVFFVMYKGTLFDELIQGLPKIFYDVW